MRLPSDAQAAALELVAMYDADGVALYWPKHAISADDLDGAGAPHRAVLWTEREDRGADTSRYEPIGWSTRERPRKTTLRSCIRHGWVNSVHERILACGLRHPAVMWSGHPPGGMVLRELSLTEDGVIALGLWRHRKLTAPQVPEPTLAGRDREIVALAERAVRCGFRLAPCSDNARADARRLAREGWTTQGAFGVGVQAVLPTARGQVEVNPAAADSADTLNARPPRRR